MPFIAISFISAGVIAYEVAVMRLYSIIQWHHFAFMIISIAMLGYGASGTFITLARGWLMGRFAAIWQVSAVLFGLTAFGGFALIQRVPFNPLEVLWSPRQLLFISLTYLILVVPFFFAAGCVGLAFARFGDRIGSIYRFDLMGAGFGAAGVIGALFVLTPEDSLRVILALGFIGAAIGALGLGGSLPRLRGLLIGGAGIALALAAPIAWVEPQISEYKGLSYALRLPDAEVVRQSSSPLGLITVVESPTIPFRQAVGLSLNNIIEPPTQLGVFIDGDSMTAINEGDSERTKYLDFTTAALPYHLLENPLVLVLGAGGGASVALAKHHGSAQIDTVEIDPAFSRLVGEEYADFSGRLYGPPTVRQHVSEWRSYVARTKDRFDLIQVSVLGSAASFAAGAASFSEAYAYTVEAVAGYLSRLRPDGFVSFTLSARLPPRDTLKLVATAVEAMEKLGIDRPDNRLAMIRNWDVATLVVKNGDLTSSDLGRIKTFAKQRSFDLAYYPGMAREEANRHHVIDAPYFYDGATAIVGPNRKEFLESYKFDLRPATDNRPFFFNFFRWESLPELMELRAQGTLPLIELGYLILVATLVQAAVLAAVLILLPLAVSRSRIASAPGLARVAGYFFALGLSFLFIEIAFIQRLVQFLGHPLYSVAVVLAAFLIFAGLGAETSSRLSVWLEKVWKRPVNAIAAAIAGVIILATLYVVALPPILTGLMPLPDFAKVPVSLVLLAPLAFCMGMPFPLGLSRVHESRASLVPWAWGINGCASVISAVLATLLAVQFGFVFVVGAAVLLYLIAALLFLKPLKVVATERSTLAHT